ncbi:hypothetical protein [Kutzneria sp. 744]|uniref:hypothetical protein n=1 Tax=Kutzneria sp. (strain 744) TaxID=345341 RepID=UPI0003EEAEFF|nr:hypothetical protein [Kutzneria sp. 744]EWM15465.1 secreted protein [Kutzneria sp. 744]
MRTTPLLLAAAAALTLAATAPATAATSTTWTADLASHNEDNSNIANADGLVRLAGGPAHAATDQLDLETGIIMFDPRQLPAKSNTVSATVDATVPADSELAVDVRGLRADGQWTEWTEATPDAPAVLPEASATVQARMMLTAPAGSTGLEARKLTLTAGTAMTPMVAPLASRSYKVYATREGLVGSTTANGHKIKSRDHFVALPSGKSLSPNGKKTYQVKVCAANGRCETAPVWDVGPWNTKDDYWKPEGQPAVLEGPAAGQARGAGGVPERLQRRQGPVRPQGLQPGRHRPGRRHLPRRPQAHRQRLGDRHLPVDIGPG